MNKSKFILLAASLMLAMAFTLFGCNGDDGTGEEQGIQGEQDELETISSSSFSLADYSYIRGYEVILSEAPIAVDSRVVSYRVTKLFTSDFRNGERFITDQDILKSLFPEIFDKAESKCNYFAMSFGCSSGALIEYWILSPDMVLYNIKPGSSEGCNYTADISNHVMLVCDDTEEGNLKDKINTNNTESYTDENWDLCGEGGPKRVYVGQTP